MTSLHERHIQQPRGQQELDQRKQPKAMVTFESHIWKQTIIRKGELIPAVKELFYQSRILLRFK